MVISRVLSRVRHTETTASVTFLFWLDGGGSSVNSECSDSMATVSSKCADRSDDGNCWRNLLDLVINAIQAILEVSYEYYFISPTQMRMLYI